ncbi:MAG TPA: MASE1 domain-containing protein [Pseudonocardia sp.]|nr:MASE1 domain-containing protein [Pseudonocardia sp.]
MRKTTPGAPAASVARLGRRARAVCAARVTESGGLGGTGGRALCIVGVAAAYYLAALVGLQLQLVHGQVTPLWPPTGIALVALLLLGPRVWPGITLGALLVNVPIGPSLPAAALIAVGNTLAPLAGYYLLRRVSFRTQLDRIGDVLALVFLGALASTLVSANVGTSALVLAGAVPPARFAATWSVWWTGDAMGVLVVAPLLLVARHWRWPREVRLYRWIEWAALLVSTATAAELVVRSAFHPLFLLFPFLIWAAVRFHERGATVCVLIVSVVTTHAAAIGAGAFGQRDLFLNMVILQSFNGSAALTALLLAAVIHQRDQAHHDLKLACAQLADLAARLDHDVLDRDQLADALRVRLSGVRKALARLH